MERGSKKRFSAATALICSRRSKRSLASSVKLRR